MLLFRLDGDSLTLPLTDLEKENITIREICKRYAKEASNPESDLVYPKNDEGVRKNPIQFGHVPAEAVYLRDVDTQERIEFIVKKENRERLASEIDFQAYVCIENINSYCAYHSGDLVEYTNLVAEGSEYRADDKEMPKEFHLRVSACIDYFMKSEWNEKKSCREDLSRDTDFVFPTFLVENQELVIKFLCYVLGKNNASFGFASHHDGHDFEESEYHNEADHMVQAHHSVYVDDIAKETILATSTRTRNSSAVKISCEFKTEKLLLDVSCRGREGHEEFRRHFYFSQGSKVLICIDDYFEELFDMPTGDLGAVLWWPMTLPIWDPRVLKLCRLIMNEHRALENKHIIMLLETFKFFADELKKQDVLIRDHQEDASRRDYSRMLDEDDEKEMKKKLQEMVLRGEKLLSCLKICSKHPAWVKYSEEVTEGAMSCKAVEELFRSELNKARNADIGELTPKSV